ncbi:MAG: AraC family transcriptional regulator [Bacillota bacterium]|nr:AraC family transcriptional regulator [Bacillota bacterium]
MITFFRKDNIEIVKGRSVHLFPKHIHNVFCIGIITDGEVQLFVKNQEYHLSKNDVYIIPPFTEHSISPINRKQYSYVAICLYGEFTELNNILLHKYVYKADDELGIKILEAYQSFDYCQDYSAFEDIIEQTLERLAKAEYHLNYQKNKEIIRSAVNFIEEHIENEIDLEEISDYVHMSKYHLLRLFKKQIGVTPYQFYLQEKVKKIKLELIKKTPDVDLAYGLNFSDQSHLCNTFKKHVGITPVQYKNSYNRINC